MNKQRIALILSLFALGIAGCGGDDDDESATTIPTVPLSVPGDGTSTLGDETDTTADTVPDTATPVPAPAPTRARADAGHPRLARQRHAAARRVGGGAVRGLLHGEPGRLLGA